MGDLNRLKVVLVEKKRRREQVSGSLISLARILPPFQNGAQTKHNQG